MNELTDELGVTLTLSHIRPYLVTEVIAGWRDEDEASASSGFIVKLVEGKYAYIMSTRNEKFQMTKSLTRLFDEHPGWLITERARNWVTDKEVLNATLPRSKQEAQYPRDSRTTGKASAANPSSIRRPLAYPG